MAERGRFGLRRVGVSLSLAIVLGLLVINVLARVHVRGMTRFVSSGTAPDSPEELGLLDKVRLLLTGIEVPRPENERDPLDLGLAFESVRVVTDDDLQLEIWRIPARGSAAGRALLLHGYAASKEMLLGEARELHRLGWESWLLDFRGSGGSDGDLTTLGWSEARDVAAATAEIPRDLPLVIFGQSMGAVAALHAVHLDLVSPDGLILEAPFGELRTTVAARFDAMGIAVWPLEEMFLWHGSQVLNVDPDLFTPRHWARSVTCPTLHMTGSRDARVPTASSEKLFESLGGPKSAFRVEGAGHVPLLGVAPGGWRQRVEAFLARF